MSDIALAAEDPDLWFVMDVKLGELKSQVADLRPHDPDLQSFTIPYNRYTTSMSAAEIDRLSFKEMKSWPVVREEIAQEVRHTRERSEHIQEDDGHSL